MKREKKDHPIIIEFKIGAFILFVAVPVLAWQTGQNLWARLHDKE